MWPGAKALELGAGTGSGGLAAALMGGQVLLTDREPLLPVMELNIALNAAQIAKASGNVQCGAYDWLTQPSPWLQ